jgi:hypothetical protein
LDQKEFTVLPEKNRGVAGEINPAMDHVHSSSQKGITSTAYADMCSARQKFVDAYRIWLAASPMPGHVNQETYATMSQIRQLRELWIEALPPARQS